MVTVTIMKKRINLKTRMEMFKNNGGNIPGWNLLDGNFPTGNFPEGSWVGVFLTPGSDMEKNILSKY